MVVFGNSLDGWFLVSSDCSGVQLSLLTRLLVSFI